MPNAQSDQPDPGRDRAARPIAVRWAARVALVGVALALPLLLLEAWLAMTEGGPTHERWRTRGLHRDDPELIYSLRPSSQAEWSTAEFVERASTNAAGLRGPELSAEHEQRPRVLILGDSMTYGHGVADDESYPARLQALFAERRPDAHIEVINAGVKGYGTDHAYKSFKTRLRGLRPRVVVFALNYNDYEDNLRYPLYRLEAGALTALDATDDPLYRVARLSQWLPASLAEWRVTRAALQLVATLSTQPRPRAESEAELVRAEQKKLLLQLGDLTSMGQRDGFALVVLGLPFRDGDWDPFGWLSATLRAKTPFLDLSRDPSWQEEKERWFFHTDEHLNPAGHGRVARELLDFLEARALIEPTP